MLCCPAQHRGPGMGQPGPPFVRSLSRALEGVPSRAPECPPPEEQVANLSHDPAGMRPKAWRWVWGEAEGGAGWQVWD